LAKEKKLRMTNLDVILEKLEGIELALKVEKATWLSIAATAQRAGVSEKTVRRAIKSCALRCRRLNGKGKILIHKSYLDAWILGYDGRRLTRPQKQEIKDIQ
jgi:excisionase family DNA binding protein